MTKADLRAADLAAGQHGVVMRSQLLELGAAPSTIRRRVREGRWRPLGNGAYLLGGFELGLLARLNVASLIVPNGVISHLSAARLHGLDPIPPDDGVAHITAADRRRPNRAGLRVHQNSGLASADVTAVGSIPVTTVERTIVDLAGLLLTHRCAQILDNAVADGIGLDDVAAALERTAERGRTGTARMRRILEDRTDLTAMSTSRLEQRFLTLARTFGLPEPKSQFLPPFVEHLGFGRVDFAYPQARLLIEVDGRRWHSRADDFETDRRRDQRAAAAGWTTLRFTWSDVVNHPDRVARIIRACLDNAAAA